MDTIAAPVLKNMSTGLPAYWATSVGEMENMLRAMGKWPAESVKDTTLDEQAEMFRTIYTVSEMGKISPGYANKDGRPPTVADMVYSIDIPGAAYMLGYGAILHTMKGFKSAGQDAVNGLIAKYYGTEHKPGRFAAIENRIWHSELTKAYLDDTITSTQVIYQNLGRGHGPAGPGPKKKKGGRPKQGRPQKKVKAQKGAAKKPTAKGFFDRFFGKKSAPKAKQTITKKKASGGRKQRPNKQKGRRGPVKRQDMGGNSYSGIESEPTVYLYYEGNDRASFSSEYSDTDHETNANIKIIDHYGHDLQVDLQIPDMQSGQELSTNSSYSYNSNF